MKKQLFTICFLVVFLCFCVLPGCSDNKPTINKPTFNTGDLKPVEQIGQIPDVFKNVVENNLFYQAVAFSDRLLTAQTSPLDEENRTVTHQVRMMDVYGNDLAAYSFTSDDAYHVTTLTATDDGGFLFVLGFSDYAYDQNTWASDKGYASRVIKCGKDGNVQFDTSFDQIEKSALDFCFEKGGQFYFFGSTQTPEIKLRGIHSPTDIYMTILDQNGTVVKTQYIVGSDYDSLDAAEVSDNGFLLSISAQSDDGDFSGSDSKGYMVDWVMAVNDSLEITEKKKESGRSFDDDRIGEKDGTPVYLSNSLLDSFDAGSPTAFIDYGDFYMIVSQNTTGIYEHMPLALSSLWFYSETVYTAYDNNGRILFRASVDSSPDYDAMAEKIYSEINSGS